MLSKDAIDALQKQIKEFEGLRDLLLPLAPGQNIDPILKKIDDLYKQLLKEFGYSQEGGENMSPTA